MRLVAGRNVRHRQQCTEQTFGMLENKETHPWQTERICAPLRGLCDLHLPEGIFASGWASIIIPGTKLWVLRRVRGICISHSASLAAESMVLHQSAKARPGLCFHVHFRTCGGCKFVLQGFELKRGLSRCARAISLFPSLKSVYRAAKPTIIKRPYWIGSL